MNLIAQNPYRVLGVFANSSIKDRKASTAKIMAFSKVNKTATFSCDVTNLLGKVERDGNAIAHAESMLSEKTKAAVLALFWIHDNNELKANIASLSLETAQQVVSSQENLEDYSGLINAAVISLITNDYETAVKLYSQFFSASSKWEDYREAIGITRQDVSSKEILHSFLVELSSNYPSVDWWTLFYKASSNEAILRHIKKSFEELASIEIQKTISEYELPSAGNVHAKLERVKQLKTDCLKYVRAIEPLEGRRITPSGQITLDKLADKILTACQDIYKYGKVEDETIVLPTLQLVGYALSIGKNSELIENGRKFEKELKEDEKNLPPKEVEHEAKAIREEIRKYCLKPDEIRWALMLVRSCVPSLKSIKVKLGKADKYYLSISTKVADNALYNCNAEIARQKRALLSSSNSDAARQNLKNALHRAWELILSIEQLNVEANFANGRFHTSKEKVEEDIKYYGVNCDDVHVSTSLLTDDELLAQCSDYASIVAFCQNHTDSPLIGQAIQKKWDIEAEAFPKIPTVYGLLEYKEKFPNSHKNALVIKLLEDKLFDTNKGNGTILQYKKFLQLYPDHPKRLVALHRIDFINITVCKTIDDYKRYLKEFPNGAYRQTASDKIDDITFSACKTTQDYKQYIANNPQGFHVKEANDKIEDFVYAEAKKAGVYDDYLHRYPNGRYVAEIKDIHEKLFYEECVKAKNYKRYLDKYPQGKYASIAKDVLKEKRQKVWRILLPAVVLVAFLLLLIPLTKTQHNKPDTPASQTTTSDVGPSIDEQEEWGENSLSTGSQPYSEYFGEATTGANYMTFNTTSGSDYVVIVKRASNGEYMNHVYIQGGETATLYLPDGTYNVYFYSGEGWNPNKQKGSLRGGFVSKESTQKDDDVELFSEWVEYRLYPVRDGNLRLESADEDDVF